MQNNSITIQFQLNPAHTVPTLDDNGFLIGDSHAICTYLVDKYAKNDALYPKDLKKRTTVGARLHFDNFFLFARIRFTFEPVLFQKQVLAQDRIEYVQKVWPLLEGCLANGNYLCGNELTVADLCAVASVSSIKQFATIDSVQYPRITAWFERLAKLPYYQELNGVGAEKLQQLVKEVSAKNQASA